ncbi:MAG: TetR/AcrR family transcriptional regulator [Nocardia sp.]|uniref:TetR/AcrR family transcriptional regulator n=1 Tax=Nocardia sp. TaxID=1821 RepID=UPI002616C585|nr:TetR/AcrR family transcriptional regulator [Nocardia sp.]MCU1642027.1 TetR/AcrR family transcriptional regulator [Nocardia sp.]
MANCQVCGRALESSERGRPAQYCSRACRARAYRERVAEKQRADIGQPADPTTALTTEHVVRSAIALADREGGSGLSMRRTAAELGVGVMSLYRYVPGKEELGELMVDAVFGDRPLPDPGPSGWRAKLELSARQEWQIYTEHPWVPQLFAITTRPPVAPRMMAYTDWRLRAVDGLGLDFPTMVRIAITLSTHTQSAAYQLARERQSGTTREQWMDTRGGKAREVIAAGNLPMIERFGSDAFEASAPQSIFDFGLRCLLDGVANIVPAVSA